MVSGLDNHSSWCKHACSHVNIDGRDFDSYLEKIFVFVQILDSGLGALVGLPIDPSPVLTEANAQQWVATD